MSPERDNYIRLSFPFAGGERLAAKALILLQSGEPLIVEETSLHVVLVRTDPNDYRKCLIVMIDQQSEADVPNDPPLEGALPPGDETARP